MIVLAAFVCALLFCNVVLIVQRQYHSYTMRSRHIDSLYAVKDALNYGPEQAKQTIDAELRRV